MAVDLALTKPDASMDEDTLRVMMAAAARYVASGLLPSSIKTPQQALTIMQMGRELGIPATYALRNIHVINGKPVAAAELLMAMVRRTYGQAAIRVREATNDSCTVEYREQGWDGVSSLTFSLEDAKRARLDNKDVWKAYPRAMLRSRAVSEAVRTAFPECIANLYTAEEMGAEVTVTENGELQIVDGEVVPPQQPTPISDAVRDAALLTGAPVTPDPVIYQCLECNVDVAGGSKLDIQKNDKKQRVTVTVEEFYPVCTDRLGGFHCAACYDKKYWAAS